MGSDEGMDSRRGRRGPGTIIEKIYHNRKGTVRMDRFCIIANREKDEGLAFAGELGDYITAGNGSCNVMADACREDGSFTDTIRIPEDTQCAIVLGGDGTILRAAASLAGKGVPMFGINLGTLGFLAGTERQGAFAAVDRLLADDVRIEERMMLAAEIYSAGRKLYEGAALNDIVVTRSGFSRLICAGVYVNGELLGEYRGDGVVASTPTGSTGYNLSAGGPIVMPTAHLILITPICPHSLSAKGIVISADDEVLVLVKESKKTQEEEAFATLDGKEAIRLHAGDRIRIRRADTAARLVRVKDRSFFDVLRTKL